ncbi:MAG: phage regulatory protein/antirepressor Ant [Prevotella sp.]|nr:phage regulatory protein/antirepressor Ant [Prevotella sp.]
MNNNNLSTITDQQTMTSLEIAELLHKNHFDVLKAIRKMEPAWLAVGESKFALSYRSVEGQGKKTYPFYTLTKKETLFVATKFNDEARAKLVLRWEQLEKERLAQQPVPQNGTPHQDPQHPVSNVQQQASNMPVDPRNMSRLQILQLALAAEEENQKLQEKVSDLEADNYGLMIDCGQKEEEIKRLEERTAYLNVIMADTSTVTVSQISQDYGMSAVAFNKLLNGLRIQRKIGEQWVLYADFINRGYVATRMIPIHHAGKPDTYRPLTSWTQPGRRFLYEHLKKHGVLPLIERLMAPERAARPEAC